METPACSELSKVSKNGKVIWTLLVVGMAYKIKMFSQPNGGIATFAHKNITQHKFERMHNLEN